MSNTSKETKIKTVKCSFCGVAMLAPLRYLLDIILGIPFNCGSHGKCRGCSGGDGDFCKDCKKKAK